MGYSQHLRNLFPGETLIAEDLLFLEAFQIKYLPDRVLKEEFSVLLNAYPVLQRFLVGKYPPIEIFIDKILSENSPQDNKSKIEESCQEALWEIADLILYNKSPELYDSHAKINWDIAEISSITSLEGKVVADVGAGSGRIAFLVAEFVETVFAVEPVSSLRRFIREKAIGENVENLFVMDGFLDAIPIPDNSLDVLLTSNAIGWNLKEELIEIERVLKPEAHAIHLLRSDARAENPFHDILISPEWNYYHTRTRDGQHLKIKYFKTVDKKLE